MTRTFFYLLLIFASGCNSCVKKEPTQSKAPEPQKSAFIISPEVLINKSFSSHLTIKLSNAPKELINEEVITISSSGQKLFMTKKIDNSHFFELLSSNEKVFVKNRNGAWRLGNSNKNYYHEIINEGLNSLSWLLEQAQLKNLVKKDKRWEIDDALSLSSPLVSLSPEDIIKAHAKGHIDMNGDVLEKAQLTIELLSNSDFKVAINFDMHLDNKASVIPEIDENIQHESLLVPINIATRFKHFLDKSR
jgi:hypothetical protein